MISVTTRVLLKKYQKVYMDKMTFISERIKLFQFANFNLPSD
ncbi:hypothetical protein ADICYQ_1204 [Cyclobacterium qasimii M12-11B]|uniref:Uncharacterized protein n=1 Tax=Cyclobacterium qasimii M12-11B TaxID=641524 RepID=S7VI30_9BACT|nr:hypothetical protein ADICYQ_1204 [Cyclobacterium qasimii M12-11B]